MLLNYFNRLKTKQPRTKAQKKRQSAEISGRRSEYIAQLYLQLKGYKLLKARYRCQFGEIDLIMKRGKFLVFVEVKKRQTLDDGLYAITAYQQRRIEKAARLFLKNHPYKDIQTRFDAVIMRPKSLPYHRRDAWRPNL